MLTLRKAAENDLDFLVEVDRQEEGGYSTYMESWGATEEADHREKIADFIINSDKEAWVFATEKDIPVAMILWRYRNRLKEVFEDWSIFPQIDEKIFPQNGDFCEIFQLWVAPEYRRQGLASRLKMQAESESIRKGINLIYTSTAACNSHVVEMNLKLGYREVRRGPIWDDIVRVSLVKSLCENSTPSFPSAG
jgi:ribosomal protein S18 acetylase RimI-like enzyme